MYCAKCGNQVNTCACNTKLKSFVSIRQALESLEPGEYFYTDQPAKQVFAVISKLKLRWRIMTSVCVVTHLQSGDKMDKITRVERI